MPGSEFATRPRARMGSKIAWPLAVLLPLVILIWSVGSNAEHREEPQMPAPAPKTVAPPPVEASVDTVTSEPPAPVAKPKRLVQPVEREIVDYVEFTGEVEPVQSVELRPRTSGAIVKVEFLAGALVKRGDPLFVLDARAGEVELERAIAEWERTQTRIERKNIALENVLKLAKEGRMSPQTVRDVNGDVSEALADERIARANRVRAQLNLEMTRVTAPIDGRIGAPLLTEGNVAIADRTHLATLYSLDPMYVAFQVDEHEALRIRRLARAGALPGAAQAEIPVAAAVGDETGFPRSGKLFVLDTVFDAATGTTRWHAVVPNADQALIPGLSAHVRIAMSAPYKALLIPQAAVFTNASGTYVSVALGPDGTHEDRPVTLGRAHDDLVIVREGRLSPQDRIGVRSPQAP